MKKLIYLLILPFFLSCNNAEVPDAGETTPEELVDQLSYLALGDSYTIGEAVKPELRWPVQLVDSLRERGIEINAPKIIARTGWTTGDLLNAMDQQLTEGEEFDLVSVLIGVNNQYQGKSIAAYEEDLRIIFRRAIEHSKYGKEGVFVVSIPDYGATPFGASNSEEIAAEIAQFNAVFEEVAQELGIEFYNITPISKLAKENPELTAGDGLHPSGIMYSLWVEEFVDEIVEKIASL